MGQVGAVIAIAGLGQRSQGVAHFSAGTGHFTDIHRALPDGRQRRSSKALLTTLTLENAMAAPAITGFSQPSAASRMPTTL